MKIKPYKKDCEKMVATITFRMTKKDKKALFKFCAKKGRSVSWVINGIIEAEGILRR